MAETDAGPTETKSDAGPVKNAQVRSILKTCLTSILLPVLVAVLTVHLDQSPSMDTTTVHLFLSDYFNGMPDPVQFKIDYNKDLSQNLRFYLPHNHWRSYVAYWSKFSSVNVISVVPVPEDSLEFAVMLNYQPKKGASYMHKLDFWFVCRGFAGQLLAHTPGFGCPSGDIEIDNETPSYASGP